MARGPARTDWHSQPGPFMGGCQGPAGHCHAVCASPPWLAAWGSQRASERTLLPLTPRAGEPAVLCMSTTHLCAELSEHCLSVGRGWELWAGVQRRQEHPPCHGPGQPGGKPRWAHPLGAGSTTFGCLPACHTNQASRVYLWKAKSCHNYTALLTKKRGRNMVGGDCGLLTHG